MKWFIICLTVVRMAAAADLSWETAELKQASFRGAQPQTTILPTKLGTNVLWRVALSPDGGAMGIEMTPEQMIETAYRCGPWLDQTPVRIETYLPTNRFDFMCNLPKGASNAFCAALKEQFGAVGSRSVVNTNYFALVQTNREAPGLKPPQLSPSRKPHALRERPGHYFPDSVSMKGIANWISSQYGVMVVDRSTLKGNYSMGLSWDERDPAHPSLDKLRAVLASDLGFALVPHSGPVEILIIHAAK